MCNQRRAKKAEHVIEAARRFLAANDEAGLLASRPTDPEVAEIAGVPLFDAGACVASALRSREARDEFREALEAWDASSAGDA